MRHPEAGSFRRAQPGNYHGQDPGFFPAAEVRQQEVAPGRAAERHARIDGNVLLPKGPGRARRSSQRPSRRGGTPVHGRELGRLGRQTLGKLLDAGLAEFGERGFQAVRVDDIVHRANTSHGTFYLYFASKDDLYESLLADALHDMAIIAGEFPVVTRNDAGRKALRGWVGKFCRTYAAHAGVIRVLSRADIAGEEASRDGLQLLFRLAEAVTHGMTAADPNAPDGGRQAEHAELTALACLMMLERVNYLISMNVRLPDEQMADRLSAIMYAAFCGS